MIREHDCIVLTANLPDDGLEAGDVGTVVHIHKGESRRVRAVGEAIRRFETSMPNLFPTVRNRLGNSQNQTATPDRKSHQAR